MKQLTLGRLTLIAVFLAVIAISQMLDRWADLPEGLSTFVKLAPLILLVIGVLIWLLIWRRKNQS